MRQKLFWDILMTFFIICFQQSVPNNGDDLKETVCHEDLLHGTSVCKFTCSFGNFALVGMDSCHPWLNCDAEITPISLISASVVKTVYLAEWKGHKVVLSVLSSMKYKDDFLHNLLIIKSFSPHNLVVQLLGYCDYSLLTEYQELGSALRIQYYLNHSLKMYDNVRTRLKLCINYVTILGFLHNSPVGKLVMCDSNSLEKALSQYLVTVGLNLVLNDLDATPSVDPFKGGIHCGKMELLGDFVAPEQRWPYPGKQFDIDKMPLYDEKTDIFKIPNICHWFLGDNPDADVIKYKLFNIHKSCKNSDPYRRPNAETIITAYENILQGIL